MLLALALAASMPALATQTPQAQATVIVEPYGSVVWTQVQGVCLGLRAPSVTDPADGEQMAEQLVRYASLLASLVDEQGDGVDHDEADGCSAVYFLMVVPGGSLVMSMPWTVSVNATQLGLMHPDGLLDLRAEHWASDLSLLATLDSLDGIDELPSYDRATGWTLNGDRLTDMISEQLGHTISLSGGAGGDIDELMAVMGYGFDDSDMGLLDPGAEEHEEYTREDVEALSEDGHHSSGWDDFTDAVWTTFTTVVDFFVDTSGAAGAAGGAGTFAEAGTLVFDRVNQVDGIIDDSKRESNAYRTLDGEQPLWWEDGVSEEEMMWRMTTDTTPFGSWVRRVALEGSVEGQFGTVTPDPTSLDMLADVSMADLDTLTEELLGQVATFGLCDEVDTSDFEFGGLGQLIQTAGYEGEQAALLAQAICDEDDDDCTALVCNAWAAE
jgi:hypothetical protein